ncbi:hypothetical protein BDP27DRAFT_1037695 [Rhodocollybia butyracea]|uniref:BTB domain-containing protein n=1 Tax=Rhodocollybia butyracea TaxID=206335 RepID=A0A9P5PZJ4_9AGAR|nr:hypothetical protein BDP27DRAFT_1037695 [Rhodocollybia butyracea]
MTTTPWYYTPNPLPSMPMTSLPTSTPMSGANPYMGSSIHSTHSLLNQPLGPSSIRSAATPGPQISSPAAPSDSEWSRGSDRPRHDGEFGYTPSAPDIPTHPLHPEDHHSRGTPMGAPDSQYPQRHERFFFPDGDIDFRVHNVVFRVHRHFFRNLGFFAYPSVDLDLCGFRPSDFASLLSIFYPKTYGTLEIRSVEEWDSVLKVVTTLGMKDIQDLAATEILKIATPVDRIVLAKKYEIHNGLRDWTIPAFRELCTMSQPLSEAEGNRIGVEGLIDLAKMKHELQHNITQFLDFAKVLRILAVNY